MAKLSAFADEVTESVCDQVQYLVKENIRYIEPRFINKTNILQLSADELKEVKKLFDDNNIGVSAIGSPIGKICLDEPFEKHMDSFKHAVDLCDFFQTDLIRIFSYYPPDNENIFDYLDEIVERFYEKIQVIKGTAIVLAIENEKNLYCQDAEHCVELVRKINSPHARLLYDPGNFTLSNEIKNNIEVCWPLMKNFVSHIHIKDGKVGAKTGCVPGQGDAQIKELFQELAKSNYKGFLTLEPHILAGGQFSGVTGPELFSQAIESVRQLAKQIGLSLE